MPGGNEDGHKGVRHYCLFNDTSLTAKVTKCWTEGWTGEDLELVMAYSKALSQHLSAVSEQNH